MSLVVDTLRCRHALINRCIAVSVGNKGSFLPSFMWSHPRDCSSLRALSAGENIFVQPSDLTFIIHSLSLKDIEFLCLPTESLPVED